MARYQIGDYIDDPATRAAAARADSIMNLTGPYSGFNYQDLGLAGGKPYSSAFLPSIGGQGDLGASPEQVPSGVDPNLVYLLDKMEGYKTTERDPERLKQEFKIVEDFLNRRGDKAQRLGLESNLVGFALKELPRILTEPARRRNRYLDDNVLSIAQRGLNAGSLTGTATGDYSVV
jgi:hypothetical protein